MGPPEDEANIVTTRIARLPGMANGELGFSGLDKPGPTIRTVAIPAWQYILIEMAWVYLNSFLGLLAVDGLGLAELTPPGTAFSHLYHVAGIALAPALLSLLKEAFDYLGRIRASR